MTLVSTDPAAGRPSVSHASSHASPVRARDRHRPHRWTESISRAVLSDLYRAARSCMAAVCEEDPEWCGHTMNRMTPLEFVQWIEVELRAGR